MIDRKALLGELRELVGRVVAVIEILERDVERSNE